jgi:AraC-like DNA-binding protein
MNNEQVKQDSVKPHMKPEDEAFMQRAMKFIEDHISDPDVNIGDMAEATATSRSGLNRKMKSLLGVTPLDFIREARIRKACTMLSQGAMVKDVAYACGFSDVVYFRKCFKAEIGMAPSEYRDDKFGK